jgi:hypothetical protein
MFDKVREKPMDKSPSDSGDNPNGDSSGSNKNSGPSAPTYKCSRCGRAPLTGPVLYCNGCGQYMCYSCAVASGDMIFDCPNCAIELQRVVL